jgi:flavin reductase (DIM6/NTAB) family NADH-FMN oxidoreductase RutF
VRAALRPRHAPVAIVSAFNGAEPVGCAVSAFLSLSLQPPRLLVSLQNGSRTLRHIQAGDRFGLSLLAEQHSPLIELFSSGRSCDRFRSTGYQVVHDVPLLPSAPAAFACALTAVVEMYDHTLVVGDVLEVLRAEQRSAAS